MLRGDSPVAGSFDLPGVYPRGTGGSPSKWLSLLVGSSPMHNREDPRSVVLRDLEMMSLSPRDR